MSIFQALEKQIADHQLEALDRKITELQAQVGYLEAQLAREQAEHKRPEGSNPLSSSRGLTRR